MDNALPPVSPWAHESDSWFRQNRNVIFIMLASVFLHVGVASTLRQFSRERKLDWAAQMAENAKNSVEIEVLTPPTEKTKQPKPDAAQKTAAQEKIPPPKSQASRIVDLPQAADEVPDKANYLAQRNMKADKETIARKTGEAENRRESGVLNGSNQSQPRDKVEAKAKSEAKEGSQGPGASGSGVSARNRDTVAGGDMVVEGGEGPIVKAGPTQPTPGETQGGGGRTGTPEVKSRDALMPSQQQLAKLIEPSQRNLVQAQHGDITLLNARSSEMAAYIIGKAKRIYSFLTINGPLLTIFYEDVQNLRFPVAVEADIDRSGRILNISTVASSGSGKIDRLIAQAAKSGLLGEGAPPEEGFEDGELFHFRFALYADHIEAGVP